MMCKRIFAYQTQSEGEIPFFKIGTIGSSPDAYISQELFDDYKEKYNYPRVNEVMITCAGTVGRCWQFDGTPSYYQDSNIVWIDNPQGKISNNFIYRILERTDWSKLNSTTITRIYNDNLRNLKCYYPAIEEQNKITDFLSLIDQRIEKQRQLVESLKKYKRGLLSAIFERKIRFKDDNGNNYPAWKEHRIKDIFTVTRGYVLAISELRDEKDDIYKYPVYSSQTKREGLMGYYSKPLYKNAITWTTDGANAGYVKYRNGEFYCTNVCGVLLNDSGYANAYIAEKLNSVTKKHVSYVGNPKLMNNVMSEILIEFPSIQEQRKLSKIIDKIDFMIKNEERYRKDLENYKIGLLQQMFI